ncbi:MAG TPA: flagellar biosynthetic protein FliP [Sulfurihydrogenibium sp.]|nr:flagellar biosynthetic protein FliP [Sulfurihydrogenibium sp. YO3AOP1]HBT98319.1 flagellar biosynthetic protein FliP [Sulfurihydrogenibium sp.]
MGIFIEPKQKSLGHCPLYDMTDRKVKSKRYTFLKPAKIFIPWHYYVILSIAKNLLFFYSKKTLKYMIFQLNNLDITNKIMVHSETKKESDDILNFSCNVYLIISIIIVLTLLNFSFSYADTFSETLAGFNRLDTTLKILLLITIISIAPALLISVTAFVRIVIVLSLLRHALGIPTAPPNQVIVGLALFLTIFVMKPTFDKINEVSISPYLKKQISDIQAIENAKEPLKEFMLKNTRKEDLKLFLDLANEKPLSPKDISISTLIPAFMISEIKTAFEIVFIIYLPFLVIDFIVASILMSMGMMMIPPMFISLPFKLMLFVLADGFELLVKALVSSYK